MLGFGAMYFGLGQAVIGGRVPDLFAHQRLAGTIVILAGAGLISWALVFFRSWKFRAKIESDHELATGGPFALMRHPIYMGLNLLAIGSTLWVPSTIEFAALILFLLGSDLRARSEEKILLLAFGERYSTYMRQTKRFVPGLY
jgi:protein-S-isoprenylcysteine O-methyltransferase Ste14